MSKEIEYKRIQKEFLELCKKDFNSNVLRNYKSDVLKQVSFGNLRKDELRSLLTKEEKYAITLIDIMENIRREDERDYGLPTTDLFLSLCDKPNSKIKNPQTKKFNLDLPTLLEYLASPWSRVTIDVSQYLPEVDQQDKYLTLIVIRA